MKLAHALFFTFLLTLPANSAITFRLVDDFSDSRGPHFGPPCSSEAPVSLTGATRSLCPGIRTTSMEVAAGLLSIDNSLPASSFFYTLPGSLAGAYLGFFLDMREMPDVPFAVNLILDGVQVNSYTLSAGTTGQTTFFQPMNLIAGTRIGVGLALPSGSGFSARLGNPGVAGAGFGLYGEVPEPGTALLTALGLVGTVVAARRRSRRFKVGSAFVSMFLA